MEDSLIARIQAGDDGAVGELAAVYSGKIHRIAFRYLRNREDAEEVVQDVLFTIARKSAAFRGDAALSTWIHRIAFNATMTRLRRATRRQPRQGREAGGADTRAGLGARDIVDRAPWPDTRLHRSQLRRRLRLAILGLPVAYRAPVVLRDLEGLSTAQAGAALALKEQTLKSRLHRGRVMLRDRLSDFSAGPASHTRGAEALTNATS